MMFHFRSKPMTLKTKLLCLALLPVSLACWSADESAINPRVVSALEQMGDHLRSLPKFQVDAQFSLDVVNESGQKIKTLGTSQLTADGRSRLKVRLDSDRQTREFFYDGKKFTQYSPRLKFYTTVNAPDNVQDMLHAVEAHYALQVPMEDLFQFGTDSPLIKALTAATYVGPSTVNGKVCDHLAFRRPGVDWQVWLTRAEKPLPCKLVVTRTDKPAQPEYAAVYRWNLNPKVTPAGFTFQAHAGDAEIPFKKIAE